MKRAGACLLASGLALFAGSRAVAAEISGRAIDAQTSEPIVHARITVHVNLPGNLPADLVLLTDSAGAFAASNLPEGNAQFSGEKAGYVPASLSQVPLSDKPAQLPLVLRLTRQAVIEGTVVDENNVGLPSTLVQLFQYRVFNGWRRLQGSVSAQTDEMGGFRISGLSPGRYYLGTTARFERLRNPKKLVYAPTLYPDATDISAAQPIDLQPGSDEHIKVRLRAVVSHQVRGRVIPAGRPNVSLRVQDLDRFPLSVPVSLDWDEKTGTFTIRDAPPGTYVLEAGRDWTGATCERPERSRLPTATSTASSSNPVQCPRSPAVCSWTARHSLQASRRMLRFSRRNAPRAQKLKTTAASALPTLSPGPIACSSMPHLTTSSRSSKELAMSGVTGSPSGTPPLIRLRSNSAPRLRQSRALSPHRALTTKRLSSSASSGSLTRNWCSRGRPLSAALSCRSMETRRLSCPMAR